MSRPARVSADCLAQEEEQEVPDFAFAEEKTVAERRLSGKGGGPDVTRQASGGVFGGLASAGRRLSQGLSSSSAGGATLQGLGDKLSRAGTGLGQAVEKVAAATPAGVSVIQDGISAAWRRGSTGMAAGEPSAELALGLVGSLAELMLVAGTSIDAEQPQVELATHLEALLACQSLNHYGACLLDFWYVLRGDSLAPWATQMQYSWVRTAYAVKYGDLRAAPGALALGVCGLLVELGQGFRSPSAWKSARQQEAWLGNLQRLIDLARGSPPPSGWGFPALMLVRQASSAFDEPVYTVAHQDQAGGARVSATDVVASSKTGGKLLSHAMGDLPVKALDETARSLMGGVDELANQAGGASLVQKCVEKGDRLFNQKTKPVLLHNQASMRLKACLFAEDDKFCAVPLGGSSIVGGSCVVTLDPNMRAQLRPPGTGDRFQLKVLAPGLIEKKLYFAVVQRGGTVQLRSHDCSTAPA